MNRILIAEALGFSPRALERLATVGDVTPADLDRDGLLSAVATTTVLWVRLRHRIDAEVIARAPELRIIASPTTGLDHIDLEEAARRQIEVISLRGATEFLKDVRATAELTIALILSVLRHVPAASRDVLTGRWDRDLFKGRELRGKTVGLVGLGRLGTLVARYLHAFGAHLIATDPHGIGSEHVAMTSLPELLATSDIVSIHVNLTPETRGLIGREQIRGMKPGAVLINTARGEIVDSGALLEGLQSGRLAGAALDVLPNEHAGVVNQPLVAYAREHPELIITPHIGGCTYESMEQTEVFLAERVCAALSPR